MKNKMTMINRVFKSKAGIMIVLAILLYGVAFVLKSTASSSSKITNQVVQLEEGYGYEILLEGKVIIHQEYIPGVRGYRTFQNEENAQKVADLVVERFKSKESPSIKRSDLEKIGLMLE